MAQANTLKIFEILRPVFDEKQSAKIAEAVEEAVEEAIEANNESLLEKAATKSDILALKEDIGRLGVELAETKAEIIRWMFIFWVGQFAAIVGTLSVILFSFFKR